MAFQRTAVLVLAGLLAATPVAPLSAAEKGRPKPRTAEAIAKEWRYQDKGAKAGRWLGISPQDFPKLYTARGALDGASYADAWNFYATKCGANKRYSEKTFHAVAGRTKGGHFTVLDDASGLARSTAFGFRARDYFVSVQLRPAGEKGVYVSITVAVR
jgi:hypothetical protein